MKRTLLALGLLLAGGVNAAQQPNILWIITDDQRPDSIEAYNQATIGTSQSELGFVMSPNINQLAKEGVLFTNAYSNAPMCTPSRASMQTGRYPFRNGHYKSFSHQTADFVRPTAAQTLRENGYGTAVIGKTGWGIQSEFGEKGFYDFTLDFKKDLEKKGFGDFYNNGAKHEFLDGVLTMHQANQSVRHANGKVEKFIAYDRKGIPQKDQAIKARVYKQYDILPAYTRINSTLVLGGENPQPAGKTIDGYIGKEFKNFLKNQGVSYESYSGKKVQGADPTKPLMVNLSFHFPHSPVLPPKEFRDLFKNKNYKLPEFDINELAGFPPQLMMLYNEGKTDQFTTVEKLQAVRDYYAFCAYGDSLIGEAVAAFKEYNRKNNQEYLIIYTVGDHGWHLGEQGLMAKFSPWKQSLQNAAIVVASNKAKFPANTVNREIVEYVDFAPTMLAAAGLNINDKKFNYLDGQDLAQVVAGKAQKRDYMLGEMNVVYGHRAFMRGKEFAFSMRTRDKWQDSKAPYLNDDISWALTVDRPKAEMALYDLRVDPLERKNLADQFEYRALADWFRQKLGTIVLGDGRVEADWKQPNSYNISNFAGGADNKKLDIPTELIPQI